MPRPTATRGARRWWSARRRRLSRRRACCRPSPRPWCCRRRAGCARPRATKLIPPRWATRPATVTPPPRAAAAISLRCSLIRAGAVIHCRPTVCPRRAVRASRSPAGAVFVGVMMGNPEDRYLLASDAGYGFVAKLADLYAKNKAGKAVLSLPKGARVLQPTTIKDPASELVAAVSNLGRMLVVPLAELSALAKGKGDKIIGIPSAKVAAREEFVAAIAVVAAEGVLTIHAGQRHMNLKRSELESYLGERGRRGVVLPRGFQKVDRLTVAG